METQLGKKIERATIWSSVTEIMAKLITPIVNMVLARVLAPEAFGAVATISMIISFAEIFSDAGFQKYIIQHEFESKKELEQSTTVAFWTNLGVSLVAVLIICLFRHPLANLVGSPRLGNAIAISSVNIILVAFSSIQTARYRRDFDFKTLFYSRFGSSIIPLVITVPLALVFKNYWALILGTIVSNCYIAIILTVKSKWKPRFYYSFKQLKEMLSFSLWTMVASIAVWLTSYIDVFIVGSYLNEHYLGIYKTSMSTVNAYMGIVAAATTPVLFSALSRYQNNDAEFKKSFYSFQRLTAVLLFPMGMGIFIFSDLVTEILLGSQWTEAAGFVGLWGLTSAFSVVISNYNGEVHRSKGNPKITLISQCIHLVFLTTILIISVRHGFKILYIARSLTRIQAIVTSLIFISFLYGFKIKSVLKNIFPPFVCALIMGTVGYGLKSINNSIIWQFVCIVICIIVYFAVLFTLFPKIRKEILNFPSLRKILKKFSIFEKLL